jgi:hypothetical protein
MVFVLLPKQKDNRICLGHPISTDRIDRYQQTSNVKLHCHFYPENKKKVDLAKKKMDFVIVDTDQASSWG